MASDSILADTAVKGVWARSAEAVGALSVSRVRPAYQQVADQLLELILSGSLASGDRLPAETELASIFGVSRSTVREALRGLASRDLTYTTRGTTGGTFVARVQLAQVSDYLETSIGLMSGTDDLSVGDMFEARELLEVPSARLAAIRHNESHLASMREAIDREVTSRGRVVKFRVHRNFHSLVVQAAGNSLLSVMTEPVFRVLQSRFLNPNIPEAFWGQVDHDHEEILRVIKAGDGDAAAIAMREHLVRLRPAYGKPGD
ncbi:MAG TPA: FCD domain-containing protein [Nocardioidaceae bacterium]|nr:FCD domain-containing protein [Nocardioidaceae bacterium]